MEVNQRCGLWDLTHTQPSSHFKASNHITTWKCIYLSSVYAPRDCVLSTPSYHSHACHGAILLPVPIYRICHCLFSLPNEQSAARSPSLSFSTSSIYSFNSSRVLSGCAYVFALIFLFPIRIYILNIYPLMTKIEVVYI